MQVATGKQLHEAKITESINHGLVGPEFKSWGLPFSKDMTLDEMFILSGLGFLI